MDGQMLNNETDELSEESVSEYTAEDTDVDSVNEPDAAPDTEQPTEADLTERTATDYEALMEEDLATLKAIFPELRSLTDISRLHNPLRYAALRDMGLSAEEAYMAASAPRHQRDSRAHLSSAAPKSSARSASRMTQSELSMAREMFTDLSDAEIQGLYKRVSG